MAQIGIWQKRRIAFLHRFAARKAVRSDVTTQFTRPPEPRTLGVISRGQQLLSGQFLFSGLLIQSPKGSIWDIAADNPSIADELHGCLWLDDLAAVATGQARDLAQEWVFGWIDLAQQTKGRNWTPGVTGMRLIRWINHADCVLKGATKDQTAKFYRSLAQQTQFLSRRWPQAKQGLRRFEALSGLIYASAALDGFRPQLEPALNGLVKACGATFDRQGGIPSRNPEELLSYLMLLNLAVQALADIKLATPAPLLTAIETIVPNLRAVRHVDGGLARFHGGGRGVEGRLDQALAQAAVRSAPEMRLYMGYARLSGGRTSVVVDASAPPKGADSREAHASTLAFELTSGRRPVIVNVGSGARFGTDWRRASRATPSHSTLGIDGQSSARLDRARRSRREELVDGPEMVRANLVDLQPGRRLESSHNGYQNTCGLTHARILSLSVDGRSLEGEDLLATLSPEEESLFDARNKGGAGIAFAIRFHLHPEVEAHLDPAGQYVTLALNSGETWALQGDGTVNISLAPSVYLQDGLLRPRSTQQVVLSGRAMSYATRVRWTLAKTQDTPTLVRDLAEADLAV